MQHFYYLFSINKYCIFANALHLRLFKVPFYDFWRKNSSD